MDIAGQPFGLSLIYPLTHTIKFTAHDRAVQRRAKDGPGKLARASSAPLSPTPESSTSSLAWKADSSRLPKVGKKRYYGVRFGRLPGIYYTWSEAEKQVTAFQGAVHQSFSNAKEVEDYMNHMPNQCIYNSCGRSCKAPVRVNSEKPSNESSSEKANVCECCGIAKDTCAPLCDDCFANTSAWLDCIIKKHDLIEEQSSILRSVADGRNVFFTGAAGTGKSTVIHAIKDFFRGLELGVETIAFTGTAALNVEGQTLHRYAGWNPNTDRVPLTDICTKYAHFRRVWNRIDRTDVLIIDEISMIQSNTLTRLSQMMQASMDLAGRGQAPFGGVQVIVAGDFYQLPPVKPFGYCVHCGREMERDDFFYTCEKHGEIEDDEKWAFCSPVWKACEFEWFELRRLHRQRDPIFQSILEDLRTGRRWTREQIDVIFKHQALVTWDAATKICPRRSKVDEINSHYLNLIDAEEMVYTCVDHFQWQGSRHADLEAYGVRVAGEDSPLEALEGHRFRHELELKLGMRVILLTNMSGTLVNGSTGHITGFVEMQINMPRVWRKGESPETPGKLLYGPYGQYQVERIKEFERPTPESSRKWPVVKFKNSETRIIFASCFVQELGRDKPYSLLSRTQIPLVAGWAITVPKSQGMTLDSVAVDLADSFELGQAYVALSRARSLDGLIVQTLPKERYTDTNPVVENFLDGLFGDNDAHDGSFVKNETDVKEEMDVKDEEHL